MFLFVIDCFSVVSSSLCLLFVMPTSANADKHRGRVVETTPNWRHFDGHSLNSSLAVLYDNQIIGKAGAETIYLGKVTKYRLRKEQRNFRKQGSTMDLGHANPTHVIKSCGGCHSNQRP